jgi:glucose dehydrogenase
LRPAAQELELTRVKERLSGGYVVRRVQVPFCEACIALREAKTARQVLFQRVAAAQSVLLALIVAVYIFFTTASIESGIWSVGENWAWRGLLGALGGLILFGGLYMIVRPWARRFQSPETRAALQAVSIADFDWETTTLRFADDEYAARFSQANDQRRAGIGPGDG